MSGLKLDAISRHYGSVVAVDNINLTLPKGQFISFLGPSGCGKTTLLRLIAGLEKPTKGAIWFDDEALTDIPTHKRGVGMVFQSLALFPHLNVGENVTYGQKIRGIDKTARRKIAEELLETVRLPGMAGRDIKQLSGGQRQRVAIARALALEPKLFLLDEPLSALDANLREELQVELRMLQQRLGITTVIVTHDQREAMTMSDCVVVMSTAKVQQVGAPLEIYRNPETAFVADFIGSSNLLEAKAESADSVLIGDQSFQVGSIAEGIKPGDPVIVSARPEDVHVLPLSNTGDNRLKGRVSFVRDVGASVETFVDCAGVTVISHASPKDRPDARMGDEVFVELPAESCVVVRP